MVTIRDIKTICTAPEGINLLVVKVETSEPGLYGLGCGTFAYRHLAVKLVVEEYLRPLLIGRDVSDINDIWQLMHQNGYWRSPCSVPPGSAAPRGRARCEIRQSFPCAPAAVRPCWSCAYNP